jgi:hypothetical protein
VARVLTAADAPELTARLSALAHGVLVHQHPVAAVPHRDLCGDCPGRPALCSWHEEMTLRAPPGPTPPDPQASAGDFSGSTGPS